MRATLEPLASGLGEGLGPLRRRCARPADAARRRARRSRRLCSRGACSVSTSCALLDPEAPSRLLFVGPNLARRRAARRRRGRPAHLGRAHEVTHAVQFAGGPVAARPPRAGCCASCWPRSRSRSTRRGCSGCPRATICARWSTRVARAAWSSAVAGAGAQRDSLDRVQATMALLEGHAEHVMDAAGAAVLATSPGCAPRWTAAARERSPLLRLLERLLGLDLKMRQYELGQGVLRRGRARRGFEALNRAWVPPRDSHARRARGPGLLAGPNRAFRLSKVRRLHPRRSERTCVRAVTAWARGFTNVCSMYILSNERRTNLPILSQATSPKEARSLHTHEPNDHPGRQPPRRPLLPAERTPAVARKRRRLPRPPATRRAGRAHADRAQDYAERAVLHPRRRRPRGA